jgi:hypothetical protein
MIFSFTVALLVSSGVERSTIRAAQPQPFYDHDYSLNRGVLSKLDISVNILGFIDTE